MHQKTTVILGIVGVATSLILGLLSIISWQIVAILIAVFLGIPSLILTYEKVKSDITPDQKEKKERALFLKSKETLREETIVVRPNDGFSYEVELSKGDHLKGSITSNEPLDVYFVDSDNFVKWAKGRRRFDYENCNEALIVAKIDYSVPKTGTWYLIMENNGRKSAKVSVHLF